MEITKTKSTKRRRESPVHPLLFDVKKKQRSSRPRRVHSRISPVLCGIPTHINGLRGAQVRFTSSNWNSVSGLSSERSNEVFGGKEVVEVSQFRRITRSYLKRRQENDRRGIEVEVSESSVVESNCEVSCEYLGEQTSKLKARRGNVKKIDASECSDAFAQSEISSILQVTGAVEDVVSEIRKIEDVSVASVAESCYEAERRKQITENLSREHEFEISEATAISVGQNFNVTVDPRPHSSSSDYDLTCTELLSEDDSSDSALSNETLSSELQSAENSDFNLSDYTPSIFLDSGSEFSVDSTPSSSTYKLFTEYRNQFSRSTTPLDYNKPPAAPLDPFKYGKFEDEEDEESYKLLRERERTQVILDDYTDGYRSSTNYGDLILQQRSTMVQWIFEESTVREHQKETMFLGVNLLDRFLSKGFFINRRNLQIAGIACLTLATRIEENQPYNSIRQKNFRIENNIYSRSEVVAMEWLVQEVLSFQCFLPTTYNFLWFYLKAARADALVEKRAKYLAELVVSHHKQLCYWPSTIAAAITILASLESNHDAPYERVIEVHVRTRDNDLPDCIKSLEWLLQYLR